MDEVSGVEEPFSVDPADSAVDETDHHAALGILARDQDMLFEVNAAIRRILEGTYGICEDSGQPIPPDRLRAVPWTRYTREVEERLEETARPSLLPSPPHRSTQNWARALHRKTDRGERPSDEEGRPGEPSA